MKILEFFEKHENTRKPHISEAKVRTYKDASGNDTKEKFLYFALSKPVDGSEVVTLSRGAAAAYREGKLCPKCEIKFSPEYGWNITLKAQRIDLGEVELTDE